MKIVFFGAAQFVLPIVEVLQKNFDLALVVTTETLPTEPVSTFCKENNIPFLAVKKIDSSVIEKIKNADAKIAVLAYFGLIIPQHVLDIFPKGILNIHPSLLPKYRGPTPVQTAIINGDKITGTTLMKLDERVDHGPILDQVEEEILPTDTTVTLHDRLFAKGAQLLLKHLPAVLEDKITLKKQDDGNAVLTSQLTRTDGFVDSNNLPTSEKLDRMIRGLYPWPGVWTKLTFPDGKEKVVKLMPENKLQVEGGKPMSVKDFINGYPQMKNVVAFLNR